MENRRELEIKNSFIEYLDFLIKGLEGIDYDKVQCEERVMEVLAKDFVKDLTKLLTVLKTNVTIDDILGYVEVDAFADDMPFNIILDERFQKLSIPDELIYLRRRTIDLGNNYSITAQGDRDYISIIIQNRTITAPKLRDENPGGVILFYNIDKVVNYDGDGFYRHSILIEHPIANMNFINHYMANLNFIKRYEESGDDDFVKKDVESDVESVETDAETCEEKDNLSDDRELVFKNQFVEYLDHLITAFKAIDYNQTQGEDRYVSNGARVVFYKDIVNQIINLLTVLKSKVTVDDIVGNRWYSKFASKCCVALTITGRFPEISIPHNYSDFFLKYLYLGNGYKINLEGVPRYRELYIYNDKITSPVVRSRYNLSDTIIGYFIKQRVDSEGNDTHIEHEIKFYNPIANLRFIKGYPDDDDPVETDIEVDENDEDDDTEWDVEEDDFQLDDWFPGDKREEESDKITVSKSENTESIPSDNNKTLNFSLPGPNGTKMTINLNINITFE